MVTHTTSTGPQPTPFLILCELCFGWRLKPAGRVVCQTALVFFALLVLAAVLERLGSDLLVVLLQGRKVLTGLGELALLHALTDVPVDEGTLGVHEVELVVEAGQDLRDGGGIGHHADGAHDFGEIATGDDGRGLVVDANLEAAR